MIDTEQYIYQLVRRDIVARQVDPVPTVAADLDVDTISEMPFWSFTLIGDGQIANGPGLWTYQVTWNVFAEGRDATFSSAADLYELHQGWAADSEGTVLVVDGQPIWLHSLEDVDLFSRTGAAVVDGRDIVQFSGTFALAIRS